MVGRILPIASTKGYAYTPSGGSWTLNHQSGIVKNRGGFGNPNAPDGVPACFLQQSGYVEQVVNFPVTGVQYCSQGSTT